MVQSKVTAMGFENDGFVVDDEDNEGSDDGDGSSDSRKGAREVDVSSSCCGQQALLVRMRLVI